MACERLAAALNDHAAGAALDPKLAIHLTQCGACRVSLQERQRLMSGIDRDLHGALSVDPSGDFAARVRTRIALQPAAPMWWSNRVALSLAACLVVVLAGGVALWQQHAYSSEPAPVATVRSDPAQPETRLAETNQQPLVVPPRNTQSNRRDRRARTITATVAARAGEPEVLVPPTQAEAIRRLVRAVTEGRLEVPPPEPPAQAVVVTVAPVTVAPVAVPPIVIAAASTGKPASR